MNLNDRSADPTFAPGETASGEFDGEVREKPTKAIIGIGVLVALSLLLYEVNQFTKDDPSAPSQNVAQRQMSAPAPQTSN